MARRSILSAASRSAAGRASPQRVLVVQLLQHLVGQAHAVELPERVVVAVVVEVLVVGLEHAPVSTGTRLAAYASLPNSTRSWYLMKNSRAARGWRPKSYSTAPTSSTRFGSVVEQLRRRAPGRCRASRSARRCTASSDWPLNSRSRSPISSSNVGSGPAVVVAAIRRRAPVRASARCAVERREELLGLGGVDDDRNVQARAQIPDRLRAADRRP